MNRGAESVRGDVLVFLHADCRLPNEAFDAMAAVLAGGPESGLFAIDYGSPHPLLRLMSWLSRRRSRWTEFGEGVLFVRRERFEAVGQFPEWPLFEDVELLARLRRCGEVGRARAVVQASPRRFLRRGVLRGMLRNAVLLALFHCGVSPHRLCSHYEDLRARDCGGSDARPAPGRAPVTGNELRDTGLTRYGRRVWNRPSRCNIARRKGPWRADSR